MWYSVLWRLGAVLCIIEGPPRLREHFRLSLGLSLESSLLNKFWNAEKWDCVLVVRSIDTIIFYFKCYKITRASVVQLVRTSPVMRVVMSSSPDWSEHFLIFYITYDSYYGIIGMAKWFGAHFNQEVRFYSAVNCKKDPWTYNFAA